jgi:hypothetical protein
MELTVMLLRFFGFITVKTSTRSASPSGFINLSLRDIVMGVRW